MIQRLALEVLGEGFIGALLFRHMYEGFNMGVTMA